MALAKDYASVMGRKGEIMKKALGMDFAAFESGSIAFDYEQMMASTGFSMEEIEREFDGQGYGVFKPAVGEAVVETLRPIREEAQRILKDKAYLESVYRAGAEKASRVAERTLRKVYKKVGFVAR